MKQKPTSGGSAGGTAKKKQAKGSQVCITSDGRVRLGRAGVHDAKLVRAYAHGRFLLEDLRRRDQLERALQIVVEGELPREYCVEDFLDDVLCGRDPDGLLKPEEDDGGSG